jgi:hypothetical protein
MQRVRDGFFQCWMSPVSASTAPNALVQSATVPHVTVGTNGIAVHPIANNAIATANRPTAVGPREVAWLLGTSNA